MTLVLLVALLAGALIGLSLGAVGAGGSILAVPVLVLLLGQDAAQATTGSLVVVAVTAATAAVAAHRSGTVLLGRGLAFGAVAIGGAVVGAHLATRIDADVLLLAFSGVMVVAGVLMLRARRDGDGVDDEPIIAFRPAFVCRCPRAAKVLVTATATGLLTGLLGVGGGFLVVPALVLALGLDARRAVGTSLVVITVTSAVALAARVGNGVQPDWAPVVAMTLTAVLGAHLGVRFARRTDPVRLTRAFVALVLAVAVGTAVHALA